ncbi:MAG: transglycosylase SLT domain-containing protein [Leptospiraceae bacterium]|nr:transglycosylase SLT domain-containing protein [Leptospiraceae bacterium]MDW8307492.1 transglycosylase SLT domain-containing protein [Leptospiraceae bacterium]
MIRWALLIVFTKLFLTVVGHSRDLKELEELGKALRHFHAESYKELKNFYRRFPHPHLKYTLAYRIAKEALREKDLPEAFTFFCESGFIKHAPGKTIRNSEQAVLFFRKATRIPKSLFYEEALLSLTQLALEEKHIVAALWFLEELKKSLTESHPLYRPYLAQYGRYLSLIDKSEAARFYLNQAEKIQDPEFFLNAADLFLELGDSTKSRQIYQKVLEYPANDFTYLQAARRLMSFVPRQELTSHEKLRLAEAYRIMKEYEAAKALFQELSQSALYPYQYYYYQNYTRLLIDTKDFANAQSTIQEGFAKLSIREQGALLQDATNRLWKANRFEEIIAVVPEKFPVREVALNRIKALYKTNHPERLREALYYLQKHDPDSYYAEKTAFSVCLEYILSQEKEKAKSCLYELIQATRDSPVGGHSRYHLGKLLAAEGNFKEAKKWFQAVYLNSPEDTYLERALLAGREDNVQSLPKKGSIAELRQWLAANGGHETALRSFFQEKRKNPRFAVDVLWLELEQELALLGRRLSEREIKGAFLFAIGFSQEAMRYLEHSSQRNLILYQMGEFLDQPATKLYYLKQYARQKQIRLDIFFMSDRAIRTFYPTPWLATVREAAARFSLEPEKLYALMKQESMFNPRATSSANARGLMQLLPATAKTLNRTLRLSQLNLYNPRHSILLGAKFYHDLSRNYSPTFEKIAAAYNAGPGRLVEWLRQFSQDLDYFVEQIPIHETHHYVKVTRGEYDRYRWLWRYYYGYAPG